MSISGREGRWVRNPYLFLEGLSEGVFVTTLMFHDIGNFIIADYQVFPMSWNTCKFLKHHQYVLVSKNVSTPYLGKWSNLTNHIFQMGWFNHVQPLTTSGVPALIATIDVWPCQPRRKCGQSLPILERPKPVTPDRKDMVRSINSRHDHWKDL